MPLISVIVPVYKVEPYLHRCIDSILAQTLEDFELMLVDDGSPDNCPAICDEYAEKDSRIVVIHQENGGLSAARNAGIDWAFANSDSQWLTFVDSDDWIHPQMLEQLLEAAHEYNVAVSVCGYFETAGEVPGISASEMIPKRWIPEDFFVKHNVNAIIAWGKLYRKECFLSIRYPMGRIHEDEFTTHKILFQHESIVVIPAGLYFYFRNEKGITKAPWSIKRMDNVDACEQQLLFMENGHYVDAIEKAAQKYVGITAGAIDKIKELDMPGGEKQQVVRNLTRKLRGALRKYRKLIVLEENYWVYELAFPKLMRCYWLRKMILNKLCKRGIK